MDGYEGVYCHLYSHARSTRTQDGGIDSDAAAGQDNRRQLASLHPSLNRLYADEGLLSQLCARQEAHRTPPHHRAARELRPGASQEGRPLGTHLAVRGANVLTAALDVVLNLPLRRVRMPRQVLADTPAPLLRRVARVSGGSGLGQWPAAAAPQMVRGRTPRSLCSNQSRCCWSCPRASSSAWRITSISSSASRSTSAAESRLSRKQLLETLAQSVKQSHDHRRSIRRRGELRNQVAGARQGDLIQRDSRST